MCCRVNVEDRLVKKLYCMRPVTAEFVLCIDANNRGHLFERKRAFWLANRTYRYALSYHGR